MKSESAFALDAIGSIVALKAAEERSGAGEAVSGQEIVVEVATDATVVSIFCADIAPSHIAGLAFGGGAVEEIATVALQAY